MIGVAAGIARGVAHVAVEEVRAGRGKCLFGLHDWWRCEAGGPRHQHRHCRKCGAES